MRKEKSIWVKGITVFTVLCALIAFIGVFADFLLPLYLSYKYNVNTRDASSIGIIGGADGPTAVFISGQFPFRLFTIIFVLLAILGMVYLLINKYSKNHN